MTLREELINRIAYNRYELRQVQKWRLEDTAEDDRREAERIVRESENGKS